MTPAAYPDKQVFVHPTRPDQDEMGPIKNDVHLKPRGGLWTSSYRNETCAWIEWMQAEQWYRHEDSDAWLLEVGEADLYRIDTLDDLKALVSQFPAPVGQSTAVIAPLDYEAIAEVYDGIWLTEAGERNTRFTTPSVYGWDCECTLWFDWCFEAVEQLPIQIIDSQ